ncbi:MAG: MFS transporter [Nitriliruptoraceae bacterium]
MSDASARRPAWLTAPVLTVSALSVAAGLAQFGVTAVIGDVAAAFGEPASGNDLAAQVGLPTTTVGIALAVIRLASLASLPAAAVADRLGRRRVLLSLAAVGLALTSLAAAAPGFWWYVVLVALARPALSTVNALAGVVAAEESTARDRSAAIALVAAAYGLGSGLVSVGRGLLPGEPSFRLVTAFAAVPLLLLPLLARRVREPRIATTTRRTRLIPGAIPARFRRDVALLWGMTAVLAAATGPGFTFLFLYGERVLGASPLSLSLLVLAAGPAGIAGLLLGRLGADRWGRCPAAALSMAATGAAVAVGYAGSLPGLAIGYVGAVAASSAYAAPAGALAAELVPTSVRATVAGWMTVAGVVGAVSGLVIVGTLADATNGFAAPTLGVGIVVALVATGFTRLPETRGRELDTFDTGPDVRG